MSVGNSDKDGQMDWLQERLQDNVSLVYGVCLVGVCSAVWERHGLQRLQGNKNYSCYVMYPL